MGALVGVAPPVDDVLDVPAPQLPLDIGYCQLTAALPTPRHGEKSDPGEVGAHLYVVAHYSGRNWRARNENSNSAMSKFVRVQVSWSLGKKRVLGLKVVGIRQRAVTSKSRSRGETSS